MSTEMQATEGVSLEAQKAKLRAYAMLHDIELICVCADEGLSGSSLKRPGLRVALAKLESGGANALLVVKLDRLTRSVKDLGSLCETYFGPDKPWSLLSVSDAIDTRTAAGRLVLSVIASVSQWEREAVSDRTSEAMQHLIAQGVHVGAAPYGWTYGDALDAHGRRRLVEVPEAQTLILRMVAMYQAGQKPCSIARQLRREGVAGPKGGRWSTAAAQRALERAGCKVQRREQTAHPARVCDAQTAREIAVAGRAAGLSLRRIAMKLDEARLAPPRGGPWHAATVMVLLQPAPALEVRTRARQLRAAGSSIREIGARLSQEGYLPKRAARWHNQAVAAMLV